MVSKSNYAKRAVFFFWEMFLICYPWNNDSSRSGSTNLWIAVFCTVAMKKIPNNINYRATYVTLLYLHQCLTIDNISTQNILYKKAHRTVKLIWSFHVFKTPMMTHVHKKKKKQSKCKVALNDIFHALWLLFWKFPSSCLTSCCFTLLMK